MALVNPNIAMSFKPTTEYQPRNALADYAQMQQIQTSDMQMQEYRRKSEGLERIRTAISKAGGPDDLEIAVQEMMKVPEYFDQGYGIYQNIQDKKAFEEYLKGKGQPVGASPVGAPTAAPAAPVMPGQLGSGTFDIMPAFSNTRYLTSGDTTDRALDDKIVQMGQSAPRDLRPRGYATPTNALAPATATAPVAAPTNALVNPVEAIENEITQLSRFKDPRAQARVKQLERQLIAMEPTADVKTMRALGIPLTPAGYEQYRQAQRQEQLSVADRIAIAQAGRAAGPVVNVSTEKKFGEAFAGKIADADVAKMTTAESAPKMAESANRIIDLANKPDVFTGPAANIKLNIARALNVAGADNQQIISNTEQLISATGQSTLDAIKSAGLGAGQGFTDKDLKFLQGVAGGTENLTATTLKELARLQHKTATASANAWNKRVKQIPKSAVEGTGLSMEPIEVPPLFKNAPTATTLTPQDRQALEWANSNPKDPRALQIKQRLGQ
jgi:hypothetical protein